MQLQIKTLSNEKFTVECELTDTVKHEYEIERQENFIFLI